MSREEGTRFTCTLSHNTGGFVTLLVPTAGRHRTNKEMNYHGTKKQGRQNIMTCKFSNFDGKCDLWDACDIQFEHIVNSCDDQGHCLVEEDDNPTDTCEDYEER